MDISLKREVTGELNTLIEKLTNGLKEKGFGILTRIDFHDKIKEKLNETISETVILGACNPKLAFEAFKVTTDIAGLIPCNAVLRNIGPKKYSIELTRPSAMMAFIEAPTLKDLVCKAENDLKTVLETFA